MWRAAGDQSASFISSAPAFAGGVIPIFHPDGAGLVFRPHVTRLRCGKGGDSGGHCTGWCPSVAAIGDVSRYDYPGDGCGASWRVRDFGIFLQRQAEWQRRNRRLQYNEIIVDGDDCTARLPWCIDAIFYTKGSAAARAQARVQHAAFLREYPQLDRANVPLVEIDLRDWTRPFREG